jgi:histidinol-phosphate aminotransferase
MSATVSLGERIRAVVRDDVRAMKAYPVAQAEGLIKLDLMENPFGLPLELRGELARRLAALEVNRYPAPRPAGLMAALREAMDIPQGAGILLGNGSDELISILAQACARPGAKVLSLAPSFVMYEASARLAQMSFEAVPLRADFSLDLNALLEAIAAHAPALVYLSYPNNPTGNLYPRSAIEAVADAAPGLVIVDEAYQPFALESFMPAAGRIDNLVVMRTLSKSGLAGARLGYLAAKPEWIEQFDKVRPPFNVNVLTQCYVEFVLEHRDVLDRQAALLRQERDQLYRTLGELKGVTVFPSAGNFLLFRIQSPDPDAASRVFQGLKQHKVLIKDLSRVHPLLANSLRVTVSFPEENAAFLEALSASLPGGARAV